MFCAKCGGPLTTEDRGNFVCPNGLQFTIQLSRQLREQYPAAAIRQSESVPFDGKSRWFCPGCGVQLIAPSAPCPNCGGLLTKSIAYQLIEFHPHPDGAGSFY